MFDKIKGHLNENFKLDHTEEVLEESMEFDFMIEGVDEGQFPTVTEKDAPDEDRDIDGAEDTVSVNDLDYKEEDLDLDDFDDDDEELSDESAIDLDEIDDEEEEDEMIDEIINEALDKILLSDDEELDDEIEDMLEEAYKAKHKEETDVEEMEEEVLKLDSDEEETLEESFEGYLFGNLLEETDNFDLDDVIEEEMEGEEDIDGELLFDEL